jgi:predicted metal-binding protein
MSEHLEDLLAYAEQSGASACFISPQDLVVEERLASYCVEPRCPNYGQSASCPPHVQGPSQFREWRDESELVLAIKIDVPVAILHSEERMEVMRLLHEIVAGSQQMAVKLHYSRSRGFAGGSCKQIFCREEKSCLYLSAEKTCRNSSHARPSMSGFGVNVSSLMRLAGWDGRALSESEAGGEAMSWVAGLVLLRR